MVRVCALVPVFVAALATSALASPQASPDVSAGRVPADSPQGRAIQAEIDRVNDEIWSRYRNTSSGVGGGPTGWLRHALATSPTPGPEGQISPLRTSSFGGFGGSVYSAPTNGVKPSVAASRQRRALFARRAALRAMLAPRAGRSL